MKTKALFLGARRVEYPERTGDAGQKIPAYKGWNYSFYSNEWKKDLLLTQNGLFVSMTVEEKEEQPSELKVGNIYEVKIVDIDKRKCVLDNEEDTEDVDLPY